MRLTCLNHKKFLRDEDFALYLQLNHTEMGVIEVILLGVTLSLDAFTVALTLGLCLNVYRKGIEYRFILIVSIFHILMSMLGWYMAKKLFIFVNILNRWIAFGILLFIGIKMINEGLAKRHEESQIYGCNYLSIKNSITLAIALSMDAIMAGFSIGMKKITILEASQFINMVVAALFFGVSAFVIPLIGFKIGGKVSKKVGDSVEIVGGIILIVLGIKSLF